ncbi:hypothetical protein EUTSA_v10029401mg [Eutrema salsugineum]|uniref:TIR domain-containing protein n=1 Tax=Eutrema salsugineum TaxID=72664 RepID=V4N0Q6_EUTSA|nr:hypothetical protein EUTSA_v10029401mg [Eutrema salsugineum]
MAESNRKIRERWSYDVFLSFRGSDVPDGFIAFLYVSLKLSGIYTFKDDQELRLGERGGLGESISPELLKAIENSKFSLELMCFGSDDVQIIGIGGMGGIGKMMLDKAAYNNYARQIEGTSFIENFGEYVKKLEWKVHIRQTLLSDILRRHKTVFNNTDHAVKHRFRNKKLLVVFDDIEDMKQLHPIATDSNWFGPGTQSFQYKYSPKALNVEESLELIDRHAFRTIEPPEAFRQFSEKLDEYCGGLPLAMEVLAKIQISFDALNAVQKDIFLDISCFFIGMNKDYVSCILDGCELEPGIGLSVLKERCLITVHDNRLLMHDLLQDMGRQIFQGASRNYKPYCKEQNLYAFFLSLSHVLLNGSYGDFLKGLQWLCLYEFPLDSIPKNLQLRILVALDFKYNNLKRLWDDQKMKVLKKLKYLDLSHSVQLTETPDFSYLPKLEKLLSINCKKLVLIHKSIGALHKKLVLLNLEGCTELSDLPLELYTLKSVETLTLSGCSKLERLDDALGNSLFVYQLKKLDELSLDGCKGLWIDKNYTHSENRPRAALSLPFSLNGLNFLKKLIKLGSCASLEELILETTTFAICKQILLVFKIYIFLEWIVAQDSNKCSGWAVGANGRVFIPGSTLPNRVSFKNVMKSISFTVPKALNPDLVGFTLCSSYVSQQDNVISRDSPKIRVKNQTKGSVWNDDVALLSSYWALVFVFYLFILLVF